jgi:hypothetical protein
VKSLRELDVRCRQERVERAWRTGHTNTSKLALAGITLKAAALVTDDEIISLRTTVNAYRMAWIKTARSLSAKVADSGFDRHCDFLPRGWVADVRLAQKSPVAEVPVRQAFCQSRKELWGTERWIEGHEGHTRGVFENMLCLLVEATSLPNFVPVVFLIAHSLSGERRRSDEDHNNAELYRARSIHLTRTSWATATKSEHGFDWNCFNHLKCEHTSGGGSLQRLVRSFGVLHANLLAVLVVQRERPCNRPDPEIERSENKLTAAVSHRAVVKSLWTGASRWKEPLDEDIAMCEFERVNHRDDGKRNQKRW